MLFNLDFVNNIILSCFYFYFSYLLTYTAVITQIFNPIAELVIPIGIPTKEAKAETETHSVIVEIAIRE